MREGGGGDVLVHVGQLPEVGGRRTDGGRCSGVVGCIAIAIPIAVTMSVCVRGSVSVGRMAVGSVAIRVRNRHLMRYLRGTRCGWVCFLSSLEWGPEPDVLLGACGRWGNWFE